MDEQEFDEFYATSAGRITTQVHAMIGNRDEAEECVQEAFARAWSHRARLARVQHPEAWVRTVAYRLAVSRWRRAVRGRRAPDRALERPLVERPPSEDYVALVRALGSLPPVQRQAIVLHHLADLPVQDVADEVGVPVGTIKTRLRRGRASLAALLGDDTPDRIAEGAPRA